MKEPLPPSSASSGVSGSGSGGESPTFVKENVAALASAAAQAEQADPKGPKTVGSFVGERSPKDRRVPSSAGSRPSGRGTQQADEERAQRLMLENLELLEVGHLQRRPFFPSVVLGHLFMRKYGLSREQRTQVVRATGGSCHFEDVERVLRASDVEDRHEGKGREQAPRGPRRNRRLGQRPLTAR